MTSLAIAVSKGESVVGGQPVKSDSANIDEEILAQIDRVQLSQRLITEREEFFKREPEIAADRAVLAMESWQESEADVLDVRWAKLVQKRAERLPIAIFKGQLVAGCETKFFRGADPWVEYDAPNVVETMEKGRQMRTSAARVSNCSEEDWEAIGEAVRFFLGKTPVDAMFRSMESLYGNWPAELEKARGMLRQGRFNTSAPVPMWSKLLTRGLRASIEEAQAGIDRVRSGEEPDAKKAWFWQAAIIVCEALITYAHRYARLARDLAQGESDVTRRKELEQVAESCERVPEYPARTLREAIQSLLIWGIAIRWCRPNSGAPDLGRMDQYLYPYFMSDIRDQRLTMAEASDLIGAILSNAARRDGVKSVQVGQYLQGTLVTNATLGGLTREGQDANNELTYLVLHMIGLMKYGEPHYTFRVNAGTPKWIMHKAMETNRKVGGGQPQFLSDDRIMRDMLSQGEALEDVREWVGHG